MQWKALACHSERQRRISRVGQRDSSLTLRMTLVADSAICWNQCCAVLAYFPLSAPGSWWIPIFISKNVLNKQAFTQVV